MINLGKVAKFAIKVGIGSVVIKSVLEIGFELGKAFKMAQLSEINKIQFGYIEDVLCYHNQTYGVHTIKNDYIRSSRKFVHNDHPIVEDRTLFDTKWNRFVGFMSRCFVYKLLENPDVKMETVIRPHQEYLKSMINADQIDFDDSPFMYLQLRNPYELNYDFKFDDSILYNIAFNYNVLYYGNNSLKFFGPVINVKRLGDSFWTDYNLIAMDRGLPGISVNHYAADQFKPLD